ncbi:hypothetical protein ACIBK9_14560 [Nonomuraea sp. NPDC050227]|uniref:hypothetical protein n=1 Tax=Nonomuraea sp. NPDC050227 TaxID=3364360 RepID=UPI0037BC5BCF
MSRLTEILRRPRTWAVVGMLAVVDVLAVLLLPEEVSVYAVTALTVAAAAFLD